MPGRVLRLVSAAAVAVSLALPFAVTNIAGVATWKIVLAAMGLALWMAGSRQRERD